MAVPDSKWSATSKVEESSRVKEESPHSYKRVSGGSVLRLDELTFEEFCKLPMKYTFGYSTDTEGYRITQNEEYGVVRLVLTPRNKRTGEWGTGKALYKLLFDDRYFDTPDGVYVAYMEYACGLK